MTSSSNILIDHEFVLSHEKLPRNTDMLVVPESTSLVDQTLTLFYLFIYLFIHYEINCWYQYGTIQVP
jgi:hypothetical protein